MLVSALSYCSKQDFKLPIAYSRLPVVGGVVAAQLDVQAHVQSHSPFNWPHQLEDWTSLQALRSSILPIIS